jgi:hypothetical protein
MSLPRQFAVAELIALVALLLVAVVMGGLAALDSTLTSNSLLDPSGSAWVVFAYTALLGAPVVAFLGVPGYLILTLSGANRWWHVLLFGAAPGLVALPFSLELGAAAVLCGTAVAGLTHAGMRRLGSNNSSKPTPLRGAA